ncbi:MAG: Hpt domain-containing protein [Rubrivivax sp.]|nr:MAG: Hpt domain-containing protein [Rubrivivax sp.]
MQIQGAYARLRLQRGFRALLRGCPPPWASYICGIPVPAFMTAPPSAAQLDSEAIRRLRELDPGGGNKLLERVVAAFSSSLERLLPDLARARSTPTPDLTVIRHVSHTLKSSSASLGAMALSQRCADIEALARDGRTDGLAQQLDGMLDDIQQVRVALAALL